MTIKQAQGLKKGDILHYGNCHTAIIDLWFVISRPKMWHNNIETVELLIMSKKWGIQWLCEGKRLNDYHLANECTTYQK